MKKKIVSMRKSIVTAAIRRWSWRGAAYARIPTTIAIGTGPDMTGRWRMPCVSRCCRRSTVKGNDLRETAYENA